MGLKEFLDIKDVLIDVLLAIAPLGLVFILSQFWFLRYKKSRLINLFKGTLIALIGLTLFLQGLKVAFIDVAEIVGETLAQKDNYWVIIPIGFLLGLSTTLADPSIYVLVNEVEESSGEAIPGKLILITLSIGVGGAVTLAMLKLIFDFSPVWVFVPGYIIAVTLAYFVDSEFAAMSFDSGGVVTGTMVASFLLPFTTGAAKGFRRDPVSDGFGIVGIVALVPILTMLIIGVILRIKKEKLNKKEQ